MKTGAFHLPTLLVIEADGAEGYVMQGRHALRGQWEGYGRQLLRLDSLPHSVSDESRGEHAGNSGSRASLMQLDTTETGALA